MPKYTAKQIAKQISEPYEPRYRQRGKEINPKAPGDYVEIAEYFGDEKSFSLILDYTSRLYSFINVQFICSYISMFIVLVLKTVKIT